MKTFLKIVATPIMVIFSCLIVVAWTCYGWSYRLYKWAWAEEIEL